MIELNKIFAGKYDSEITEWIMGKCIQLWKSLPDNVVSSPTLNTFKARLDKFWENQLRCSIQLES